MSIPYIGGEYLALGGQANPEAAVNDLANRLLIAAVLPVLDDDLTAPPGSPTEGSMYIVASSPTGAWSGQTGKLAAYFGGWVFISPWAGLVKWVSDEAAHRVFNGSTWQAV